MGLPNFSDMFESAAFVCFIASDSGSDFGVWICLHSFRRLHACLETDAVGMWKKLADDCKKARL
jgi:hypothetical protein